MYGDKRCKIFFFGREGEGEVIPAASMSRQKQISRGRHAGLKKLDSPGSLCSYAFLFLLSDQFPFSSFPLLSRSTAGSPLKHHTFIKRVK